MGNPNGRSALRLSARLRKAGYATSYALKPQGFSKQFKEAGKSGARYALILGEEEVNQGRVKVKDMRSSTEEECMIKELVQRLEEWDTEGGIPQNS